MILQIIIDDFLAIKGKLNEYEIQSQILIHNNRDEILKAPKKLNKIYQNHNLCFDYIENQRMLELFEDMMKFANQKPAKV